MATSRSGAVACSAASAAGAIVAIALGNTPEAELPPLLRHDGADLAVGELEPGGERVRVLEQQGAGGRGHRPATPADEQLRAQLALEAAHLLRHRGLAERERGGRVNDPSRATARNVSSRRGSIIQSAYRYAR